MPKLLLLDIDNTVLDLTFDSPVPIKNYDLLIPILQFAQANKIPIGLATSRSKAMDSQTNTNGGIDTVSIQGYLHDAHDIKIKDNMVILNDTVQPYRDSLQKQLSSDQKALDLYVSGKNPELILALWWLERGSKNYKKLEIDKPEKEKKQLDDFMKFFNDRVFNQTNALSDIILLDDEKGIVDSALNLGCKALKVPNPVRKSNPDPDSYSIKYLQDLAQLIGIDTVTFKNNSKGAAALENYKLAVSARMNNTYCVTLPKQNICHQYNKYYDICGNSLERMRGSFNVSNDMYGENDRATYNSYGTISVDHRVSNQNINRYQKRQTAITTSMTFLGGTVERLGHQINLSSCLANHTCKITAGAIASGAALNSGACLASGLISYFFRETEKCVPDNSHTHEENGIRKTFVTTGFNMLFSSAMFIAHEAFLLDLIKENIVSANSPYYFWLNTTAMVLENLLANAAGGGLSHLLNQYCSFDAANCCASEDEGETQVLIVS